MSDILKLTTKLFIYLTLFYSCNPFSKEGIINEYLTKNDNNNKVYFFQNDKLGIYKDYKDIEKNENLNYLVFDVNKQNQTEHNSEQTLSYFNYAHISLSFLVIPIFSISLIIYDLLEDKKLTKKYNLSKNEKANEEFKLLKKTYIGRGRFLFSWFLMKYKYPLTNIINIYNYDHQRYIRLMLFVIKLLFNLYITYSINFYFEYQKEKMGSDIFKSEYKKEVIIYLISIFNTIWINIVSNITINCLLEHDKVRRNIFKPKLENLRKYAYYIIKKDILFNSKWHLIRNRMLSYYRICGPLILKKYKTNKFDKYERYARNKKYILGNMSNAHHSFNSSIGSNDEEKDNINNTGFNELLLQNNIKNNQKIHIFKNDTANKQKYLVSKNNDNNKNSNLCISKGVEPFSFSRYGVNNMKLKTLKKLEDIKNKYIANKNNSKYDETLDVDSYVKTFDNLEIEALDNYTYISTDAMINKLNKINSNSNKMLLNVFTNIILTIILILLNVGLVLIRLGNNEGCKIFYWPIFFLIIISDFFYYLFFCLIISFTIPKFYGYKKKSCFNRFIFYFLYEKYIRYLYRMRLLINKYHKEFNFIE